jgi:hypothetical protein
MEQLAVRHGKRRTGLRLPRGTRPPQARLKGGQPPSTRAFGEEPASESGLALASLYLIWGSTYLAILIAIDTLPPFLMAGVRFVVAGGMLLVWARSRGALAPVWSSGGRPPSPDS